MMFATMILTSGCADERAVNLPDRLAIDEVVNQTENPEPPVLASYPNYSFSLSVPWLCQMPPKNPSHTDAQAWARTNNCGQAVGAMLGGYFNNGAVAPWVIDEENRWLGFPLPYGSGTSSSTLRSLLWGFHLILRRHGQIITVTYRPGNDPSCFRWWVVSKNTTHQHTFLN